VIVIVIAVIVVVIVGALTGPGGTLSTAGLAGVPAAVRARPHLRHVVAEGHSQLRSEGRVVLPEVADGLAKA
jgi:hypothetical protein